MATLANIFTLKLENKEFNAQLQSAAKTSQDYNNKIANSLLEAAKLQAQLVRLTKEKAEAQANGDKATVKSINQQIAVTKTLIQVQDQAVKDANRNISVQTNLAKEAVTQNQRWTESIKERTKAENEASNSAEANAKLRSGFISSYVNTPAQNKYNASVAELNTLKAQGVISEGEYTKALKKSDEALKQGEPIRNNQFNHMIRMMRWAGTLAAAFYGVKTAWDATIGTGLETAAQFEQMQIGISALIATNSQNITVMGKHVTASEKFAMAQKDAADAIVLLRKANIDTPATLEQLTRGFQSALGPAMSLGFSINQTVEYSKLMTLAASALTVPMEQLSQEMRSILNGTIDQNSIVANSLGLTNAQIKAHKAQGDVYEFLIGKLGDFNAAGKEVNKSWQGVASNLSDAWKAFTSDVVKSQGIFDGLKSGMTGLTTILKNQNGELDTYSKYLKEAAILAGTYYGVTLLSTGVKALIAIAAETKAATLAQTLFNAAVRANPWVITAGLIATAVTGLYEYNTILNEIRGNEAKSAGQGGFLKDLDFISGKDKTQQVHDLVTKSKELYDEQVKLLAIRKSEAKFIMGVEVFTTDSHKTKMTETKARIAAITEEQNAIKKYLATPGARPKVSDGLKPKPPEKTAEELAKEEAARLKALRERNTQELSALTKIHQEYETLSSLEQRKQVEAQAKFNIKLTEADKLHKIKLDQLNAEERALQKELDSNSKISDTEQRRFQNNITLEKINKNRIEYANEFLQIEKAHTAEQDKQLAQAGRLAAKEFENAAKIQDLQMQRGRESGSFEQAFGTSKISIGTANAEIAKRRGLFNLAMWGIEPTSDIYKQEEEKLNQMIERIKNKIPEIPDIALNIKLTGVEGVNTSLIDLFNNMGALTKSTQDFQAKNDTYTSQINQAKKEGKDTTEDQLKLDKLITQNTYDNMAAYQSLAGAVSGAFSKGSKEAAAFTIIQQGLALTNAVAAIANAGMSSPWTGLATAAAMAAYLSPMLSQIGVALGFGGSTTTYDAFASQVANEGKGSTLGDNSKSSASITRSLSILSDIAKPEFKLISSMDKSLQSIDQKMGGLSATILRAGGFAVGEGFTESSTGQSVKASGLVGSAISMATLGMGASAALGLGSWASLGTFGPVGLVVGALDKLILGGALTNMIGGFINKVLGGIFGGGTSASLADAGITFGKQSLALATKDLQGKSYQTIMTKKDGGWFGSDSTSYSSQFSAIDEYTRSQFQLVLGNLRDVTIQSAKVLGESSADVEKNLDTFVVDLGKISLKGKTGDQIKETLTSVFGKVGDELTSTILPAVIPFQQVGEGLFETMTRVAGGMQVADFYIGKLGSSFSKIKYTEIANAQGDVALETLRQSILGLEGTSNGVSQIIQNLTGNAETLFSTYQSLAFLRITLDGMGKSAQSLTSDMLYGAGGIDALQSATSDYVNSFLTQTEQLSLKAKTMRSEFDKLNLSMPTTNAGFKAMIDGIDTSTASGQELFGRLILLSKGFADLTESVTTAFRDITSEAQNLSDAFTSMANSIQDTIDKLLTTGSGQNQASMIGSFWEKRAQADLLLAKRGDLTVKEQSTLQSLVSDINSLATNIQGAQVGPMGAITTSLVGQLEDIKSGVNLDNAIVQSRILDATGATVNVATEGTLTRLANAVAERNTLLGIDGSHADGLGYVPYDGYIAQLHKGERVLTAEENSGFGGRTVINMSTSALEAINNKIYDRINAMYNILNDAQLGSRPLYIRAN